MEFTQHDITVHADFALSVYAVDVDGDSDMDVLSADVLNDNISWFENKGTIPVELICFIADVHAEGNVLLNWTTATELNNQMFEIEEKTNKSDWRIIGYREGNGTTTERQFYSFVDDNISMEKYFYRLKQYDYDGTIEYSNIVEVEAFLPNNFLLEQNFPNPFNPSTKIKFSIPSVILRQARSDVFVTLNIYDMLVNEVGTLVDEEKHSGNHEVEFDGTSLTSGIYLYKLQEGLFVETKKMVLMK